MNHTMEDNRRRLIEAIDNIFGPALQPSNKLFMANAYVAQRRNDPDPARFDRRMNAYLRAMEELLTSPTTRFDIHQLQIRTMENLLPVIEQIDITVLEEPKPTRH